MLLLLIRRLRGRQRVTIRTNSSSNNNKSNSSNKHRLSSSTRSVRWLLFLLCLFWQQQQQQQHDVAAAAAARTITTPLWPCTTSQDCERDVGPGSICRSNSSTNSTDDDDGNLFCSNNPLEQGCLYNKLPGWTRKRVCNSEDPANAAQAGICQAPDFDYMEIRTYGGNWQSRIILAWLLQIILSELLGVPSTVESGTADAKLNLYDPFNSLLGGYGTGETIDALQTAFQLGDCRLANTNQERRNNNGGEEEEEDSYVKCAHFVPEAWSYNADWLKENVYNGTLENPQSIGYMGQQAWFITKFTAENDPTLVSYLGMQGEENRHKLAQTFLRPTTWKEYCDLVSPDHCTTPNDIAKRPPNDDSEYDRMFVEGLYLGHFRATAENDCATNPTTCTGHIADFSCKWHSFIETTTWSLNIALDSSGPLSGTHGYSQSQLKEMW